MRIWAYLGNNMANRQFRSQFLNQFVGMPCMLHMKAAIGSSGAVTLTAASSVGIASITKESTAGQYTILLSDAYNKLLNVQVQSILASGAPAGVTSFVISESVASTKQIKIQFIGADGSTATNPSSGTTILVSVLLSNSSVTY